MISPLELLILFGVGLFGAVIFAMVYIVVRAAMRSGNHEEV